MPRSRHQKEKNAHYALLVNPAAAQYQAKTINQLTEAIKKRGGFYTTFESESAASLLKQAQQAAKMHQEGADMSPHVARRGAITALIACGGDGTFNLVARAAMEKGVPVGVLPMGRFNNIARHLYESTDTSAAIARIIAGNYRTLDVGLAADQPFFNAVALGFVPELADSLKSQRAPMFGFGWAQLAAKAAANVQVSQMVIKIDAFRFELSPIMVNVHLLPYAVGLPFSTASLSDDGEAEVIFDFGNQIGEFSSVIRAIHKKKYLFGNEIRLYRGKVIAFQPVKDRVLYLDGELIPLPTNSLSVRMSEHKVKVFC